MVPFFLAGIWESIGFWRRIEGVLGCTRYIWIIWEYFGYQFWWIMDENNGCIGGYHRYYFENAVILRNGDDTIGRILRETRMFLVFNFFFCRRYEVHQCSLGTFHAPTVDDPFAG